MKKGLTVMAILILSVNLGMAQVQKDAELFLMLKKQDSVFFERGFNQCDLQYLEGVIHDDLIFYHDQSGIQNKSVFFENVKNNLCANPNKKPIRKVVENSLEVYPLYNEGELYGAIQKGVHHFYIREPDKEDVPTGSAKFTHVYLLVNRNWLLKEVLSYDHGPPSIQGGKGE